MDLEIDKTGPITVASVSGSLTGDDVERFAEELYEVSVGADAALALDLSAIDLIDSCGLSALINLTTRARLSHAKVAFVRPSAFVQSIFNATRLNLWFDICESLEEARGRLA
jgi:anti-anti-sigma factor